MGASMTNTVLSTEPEGQEACFGGLRAHADHWHQLENAAAHGDALELAVASCGAAQVCLDERDWDEALWHIQRGRRCLETTRLGPATLALRCELAELSLRYALALATDNEALARHLRDDTRDAVYDIVRRLAGLPDPTAIGLALQRAARILDALGDHSDAQGLRQQDPAHLSSLNH